MKAVNFFAGSVKGVAQVTGSVVRGTVDVTSGVVGGTALIVTGDPMGGLAKAGGGFVKAVDGVGDSKCL